MWNYRFRRAVRIKLRHIKPKFFIVTVMEKQVFRIVSIFGENQAKPCIIFICHLHCRSKCGFKTEGWSGKERKEGEDSKTFENGKRKQQDFSLLGNGQWEKTFSYQLFFPQENLERWQVIRDFYSSPAVPYSVQKVDWVNKTSTYLFCRILQNKKGWTHFLL